MIDNQSPPGSWKNELKAAPWGYGQSQDKKVQFALAEVRAHGMWPEAAVLEQEIITLKAELELLRNERR
jgi:hypothetical protein